MSNRRKVKGGITPVDAATVVLSTAMIRVAAAVADHPNRLHLGRMFRDNAAEHEPPTSRLWLALADLCDGAVTVDQVASARADGR